MADDIFAGLSDLEELGREQEAIEVGADPLSNEWRRLLDITTRIAGELDLDLLLRAVMDAAIEITGAQRGFLILINSNGDPEVKIAHNLEKEAIHDVEGSISRTVIDKVLFDRQPMLVNDVENNALLARQVSVRNLQLKSVMGAPIICREQLLGMAYVDNSSLAGVFSHQDLAIFGTFVNLAAVAIENAKLFHSLRESSEKIRALQEYYQNILARIPNGVVVLDRDNQLEYANLVAQDLYPNLIKDQPSFGEPRNLIAPNLELIRSGQKPSMIQFEENYRYYEVNFFSVLEREGKIGLLMADVSDRKRLEKQYYEEEKRGLMMQLAGGIAHEISNQLFPIQGRAQLLSMMFQQTPHSPTTEMMKSFQVIEEQVQKISRIVENLRSLSKPAAPEFQELDLSAVLMKSVEVLSSTAGKIKRFSPVENDLPYHLKTHCSSSPPWIRGDADQLQQVLMNLIINAAHALEEKGQGTLSVGTEIVNDQAVVYVEDTGSGIPEEVRLKIFDPYFTTKGEGKGTGLGLTIVQSIVQAHGGELHLDTEVGRGTRFEIRLPLVKRA